LAASFVSVSFGIRTHLLDGAKLATGRFIEFMVAGDHDERDAREKLAGVLNGAISPCRCRWLMPMDRLFQVSESAPDQSWQGH
jgi:hypothetical protein